MYASSLDPAHAHFSPGANPWRIINQIRSKLKIPALLQAPLIHPHIRQLPVLAFLQLKRQRHKRLVRCRRQGDLRRIGRKRRVVRLDGLLRWIREVRAHAVEEGLHGGVLDG